MSAPASPQLTSHVAGALREIVHFLVHTPELDAGLAKALNAAHKLLPEDSALRLFRYSPADEQLELIASAPEDVDPVPEEWALQVAKGRDILPWEPPGDFSEPISVLGMPVTTVGQQVTGVLIATAPGLNRFSASDVAMLGAVVIVMGLAEENARRGQDLQATAMSQLRAEHIAAMADMASHIAHSVVNEMGAILLAVQLLRRQIELGKLDEQELTQTLDSIQTTAEAAIALVRRIRRPFARINVEPISVRDVIEDVLNALEIPETVDVEINQECDLPHVQATGQLSEVFHHLIRNALEAIGGNPGKISIRLRTTGECVEVSVQDTGPGIAPHLRQMLFHLGATDKWGGLGYGLWWSRLYMARIGGSLELGEAAEKGAKFIVRLLPIKSRPGHTREDSSPRDGVA